MPTIVLAHGVLGFDALGFGLFRLEYFNGVERRLKKIPGVKVIVARVAPIGSIDDRAKKLAQTIAAATGRDEEVHIVAHSMGGLDARLAIVKDYSGVAGRVKTLVTIGTPHLGSPVADGIENARLSGGPLPIEAKLRVDQRALHDLTTGAAKEFNEKTHDTVKLLCIAGDMTAPGAKASRFFRNLAEQFKVPGPSDGVVTVKSATCDGKFKLIDIWPTDHAGEVGWNLNFPLPAIIPFISRPHLDRYEKLVRDLLARPAQPVAR